MTEKINIRVSFVVMLIDDFTDEVIPTTQARVLVEGEKPPILKNGEYYIFTNIRKKKVSIKISAFAYQSRSITEEIPFEGKLRIIKVRMVPDEHYSLPENTLILQGKAKPNETLELIFRGTQTPVRLIKDYSGDDENKVLVYNPLRVSLTDRKVLFFTEKKYEEAQIVSQNNEEEYVLDRKLKNKYEKSETMIYVVCQINCDEGGNYRVPIPKLYQSKDKVTVEMIKNGKLEPFK